MNREWTKEQLDAITARGGDILVSAAAGSGKTAVLAERVARLIADPADPVDADRLLVVTFTNAAASEMKIRIAAALEEQIRLRPQDGRLARQRLLLDCARISTIHSFCISLVRENFHALGLPADIRVADEREMDLLRRRTAGEVLSARYEAAQPGFFDLVELLTPAGRDDSLADTLLGVYDFVRNHPFYRDYLKELAGDYADGRPFGETAWCGVLRRYGAQAAEYCVAQTDAALSLCEGDATLQKAYAPALRRDRDFLSRAGEVFAQGDWDGCVEQAERIAFDRLGAARGEYDRAAAEAVKARRGEVKAIASELRDDVFLMRERDYAEDMEKLRPVALELFGLVAELDDRLRAAKLERSLMDFGDLEHYALALLYDTDGGQPRPSALSKEIAGGYREVLIDEYQDTNEIQEKIFSALAAGGARLFMVGDVKQSIYRFREARPEIFLAKKESYAPYGQGGFPARVALGANFRTRREITGFVNYFFTLAMNRDVGEMDYGPEDRLTARADYDYGSVLPVELALLDPPAGTELTEAQYVAAEVRRLMDGGFRVREGGGTRPLRPGDVCVLLRSPRSRAEDYAEALSELDVSCRAEKQAGFLDARETAAVVSYLKILANPLLDLELAGVLSSPMYSFSSETLAAVRAGKPKDRLFLAVRAAAGEDRACARFLADYDALRQLSMTLPVSELIRRICGLTDLGEKTRAMPSGVSREQNLRLLIEYAADYESGSGGDAGGFVQYLCDLERYGCDLPAAAPAGEDAVRVMSVHRSKGLEFPVVFFAGCAQPFNLREKVWGSALNPDLGFGCILRDNERMLWHKTLPLAAITVENRRRALSEELRILYVAMTRAREKLYLVGSDPGLALLSEAARQPLEGGRLSPFGARRASCALRWLASAAVRHADFDPALLDEPAAPSPLSEGRLHVSHVTGLARTQAAPAAQEAAAPPPDPQVVEALRAAAAWRYPHLEDTVTPAKLAVSDIAEAPTHAEYAFVRRPKLLAARSLTPAERGIAAHRFMQFCDFAAAASDVEGEIARLVSERYLAPEEAAGIDRATVAAFFSSGIGRRALSADRLCREIRFRREITPQELSSVDPSLVIAAPTVIQGVADCVVIERGRGTVVDYKTDIVADPGLLCSRYAAQLRLYRFILEGQLGLPVDGMLIYSFHLRKEIAVPPLP